MYYSLITALGLAPMLTLPTGVLLLQAMIIEPKQ